MLNITKEVAMSDLTLIAEDILNAMKTMEEASHAMKAMNEAHRVAEAAEVADEKHSIKQTLHEETNLATFDLFRTKMMELHERLSKLKVVLDNEEAFAVDELVDAISIANTGHRAEYRRTPRMNE
jgi:hypothetical protein